MNPARINSKLTNEPKVKITENISKFIHKEQN